MSNPHLVKTESSRLDEGAGQRQRSLTVVRTSLEMRNRLGRIVKSPSHLSLPFVGGQSL
jgi:hypothetical protein